VGPQPLNPVNLVGNFALALAIASGAASFLAQPPSSSGQTNKRQGDNSRQADFSGLDGFIGKIPRADIFSAAQFRKRRSILVRDVRLWSKHMVNVNDERDFAIKDDGDGDYGMVGRLAGKMTALEVRLAGALAEMKLERRATVVVGVSGGADSMSLLDGLCRARDTGRGPEQILVAHLNHQLRGSDSDEDESFVRAESARYGVGCEVERRPVGEIAKAGRLNLEAVARSCRYDFLQRVASDAAATVVFTAHTSDDQAETVLMRLLRGSGMTGLTGIHWQRPLGEGVRLIRPLLAVTRADILDHLRHYSIGFRVDQSNHSIDFMRNRIRHELLPTLRTYNPGIDELLVRTSGLLREDENCLHELSRQHLTDAGDGDRLRISAIRDLPIALRRRVIRDWIAVRRGNLQRIAATHLIAIDRLAESGQSGRLIQLPGGDQVVRVFDSLQFEPAGLADNIPLVLAPVEMVAGQIVRFGGFRLRLDRQVAHSNRHDPGRPFAPSSGQVFGQVIGQVPPLSVCITESDDLERLRIRSRLPGDSFVPAGSCHRIKLKTLMIRCKIPAAKRHTWPVVVTADDRVVWVPGLPVAREYEYRPDSAIPRPFATINIVDRSE
jgi:tRNA(Ile)-lysidine synthase